MGANVAIYQDTGLAAETENFYRVLAFNIAKAFAIDEDLNAAPTDTLVSRNTVFRYCDDRGPSQARGIVIGFTGFPSLTRDTNGDGTDDFAGTSGGIPARINLVCP